MTRGKRFFLLCCFWGAGAVWGAAAPGVIRHPGVEIDLAARQVRVAAKTSKELGWGTRPLEFVLLAEKSRGYEALFITEANPAHINLGLLMLGLKPAPILATLPAAKRAGAQKKNPAGPPAISLHVSYAAAGKQVTRPVQDFIFRQKDEKPATPQDAPLVYTGSYFYQNEAGENIFAATSAGEAVALLFSPQALLNLGYLEGSPYNELERAGFVVIVERLPAVWRQKRDYDVYKKGIITRQVVKEAPVQLIFQAAAATPPAE